MGQSTLLLGTGLGHRACRVALFVKGFTERDICTKFITPAVKGSGWNEMSQLREQVYFTKGRIIVRGNLVTRGKAKFADYILYYNKLNMGRRPWCSS